MKNTTDKNSARAKQEALATLGIYALERNKLKSILERAIDISCIILHLDCAVIFSLNKEGTSLEIGAQAGCANAKDPVVIEDENIDISFALNQDKPTVVERYSEEERFDISPYLKESGIVSSIHLIVKGSEDTYGVLGFYSQEYRSFPDEEINFLQILANMVGMAIERDQLNEERDQINENLEKKNRELEKEIARSRQFQREIINNSLMQRWDLGSYLHDNLAQIIASAKIFVHKISKKISGPNSTVADDLSRLEKIINQAADAIRDLTQDIIPIDIEEEGIEYALHSLMEKTEDIHGMNCSVEIDKGLTGVLNIKVANNLYFIVQEALKNARIHGHADEVVVSLSKDQSNIKLEITDDGKGYDHSSRQEKGRGLQIMRHRMDLFGGTLNVKDRTGVNDSGTRILCLLPYHERDEDRRLAAE